MTQEKSIRYRKAYVELYEILNILEKKQKDKIPNNFINNISNNMDKDYKFTFDESKGIFEQNLMIETEALLVEIYEQYLAPKEEKEIWQKYDNFCLNKIDTEKKIKYSTNIFENNKYDKSISNKSDAINITENIEHNDNILPIKYKKDTLFKKVLTYIKNFFNIK